MSRAVLWLSLSGFLLTAALVPAVAQPLTSDHLAALEWRPIGPGIVSGRITSIAAIGDELIYAASATGGVWKTTNRGVTWEAVFEKEGTPSVGDVALSPSNPNVVWVGTGEDFNARSNSWGDGVYKSDDGGKSWKHMGLTETRHIGEVLVHPEDPDIVYVAALGSLWGAGEERGLFKTQDGGESWSKVLYISQHTGIADIVMDPRDPDVLYAAAHQRERRNWSFVAGGPEGGLFKSTDGGESWEKLTRGLPEGEVGRIGVSVCASQPDTVYAAVAAQERGGVFRSDDRGASWQRRTSEHTTRWSYGIVRCDPEDPDRVYVPNTRSVVSEDGGKTFRELVQGGGVHVDHRALLIDSDDSKRVLLGTDGGLYASYDRGENWEFMPNLPVMQFYTVSVDEREPFYYVYGGTQDNNSFGGPSGTRNIDGIVNDDWFMTVPGDGFHVQIDPEQPHIVYTESQYGRLVRFDTRTGERRLIQPQPPEGEKYRWNWSSPILISRHDSRTLYFAANKVFRSPDRGDSWEVVSADLTRRLDHYELPLQGKLWPRDAIALHQGTSDYGNITTVSESPLEPGRLVVGTDDGQISVTSDDGESWTTVQEFPGVLDQTRVSRVVLSHAKPETIYAVFDAHKDNDFRPYVVTSDDFGASWSNITGNLPEHGSTRVIVEHPRNPDLLVVGTELSVFISITGGGEWVELKNNLPTVPVHDMVIQARENDLVLGTHGRGFWILDDMSILDELTPEVLATEAHLARIRPATQMHRIDRGRRSQGQSYFTAPNPPDGAIITYYVNPKVMADSEASTNGALSESGPPRVQVDILDAEGNLLRRLEPRQAEEGTGVQRLVWDLRHSLYFEPSEEEAYSFVTGDLLGAFVLPGSYRARLKVGDVERSTSIDVEGDPLIAISNEDRRAWHDTLLALDGMFATVKAVLSTAEESKDRLGEIQALLQDRSQPDESLAQQVASIDEALKEVLIAMRGKGERSRAEQPGAPPLAEGVRQLYANIEIATARPTEQQSRLTREVHDKLSRQVETLNGLLAGPVADLYRKLDDDGLRWSAGRPIPLPTEPPR